MSELMGPCGADCRTCEKYPEECGGCHAIEGKVWWTQYSGDELCPLYQCCVNEKHLAHCGKCPAFPCEQIKQGDPSKSEAENAAILAAQIAVLSAL